MSFFASIFYLPIFGNETHEPPQTIPELDPNHCAFAHGHKKICRSADRASARERLGQLLQLLREEDTAVGGQVQLVWLRGLHALRHAAAAARNVQGLLREKDAFMGGAVLLARLLGLSRVLY